MSATETAETATSSPSPNPNPAKAGETLDGEDESYASCFQCCVCLDLLYKPIVLACGHISCFWCVHKAMHGLQASHCALCRRPYIHFPEEEKRLDIFSPQFGDPEDNSSAPEEIQRSTKDIEASKNVAVKEPSFPENGLENGNCKQLSVDDVLCEMCNELLFQPSVLNCGHVFCETCLCGLANGPLKCPVCESLHPGEFLNICLNLDHFLEEQLPTEYAMRKVRAQVNRAEWRHGESSSSALHEKQSAGPRYSNGNHLLLEDGLLNVHIGVGCDSCGVRFSIRIASFKGNGQVHAHKMHGEVIPRSFSYLCMIVILARGLERTKEEKKKLMSTLLSIY